MPCIIPNFRDLCARTHPRPRECTRPRPRGREKEFFQFHSPRAGRTRGRSREQPVFHQRVYPPASRGREMELNNSSFSAYEDARGYNQVVRLHMLRSYAVYEILGLKLPDAERILRQCPRERISHGSTVPYSIRAAASSGVFARISEFLPPASPSSHKHGRATPFAENALANHILDFELSCTCTEVQSLT